VILQPFPLIKLFIAVGIITNEFIAGMQVEMSAEIVHA